MKFINFSLSESEFISLHFETQLFFQRRAFSAEMVHWDDVTTGLYAIDPGSPNIKIYKDGQISPEEYLEPYQDGYVVSNRFRSKKIATLLVDGATLVINKLDRYIETVGLLTQEVGDFTNCRTVANAYIAFGGDGTFGKHWDTHCVFALQLLGRKRWKVYRPTFPFPLTHQKSREYKEECPKIPIFDEILEAGDVLYIPRGWWHEALPVDGHDTLHIAVGLHTPKIHDYVHWIASHVMPKHELLRRSWVQGNITSSETNEISKIFFEAVGAEKNQQDFMSKHSLLRRPRETLDFNQIKIKISKSTDYYQEVKK